MTITSESPPAMSSLMLMTSLLTIGVELWLEKVSSSRDEPTPLSGGLLSYKSNTLCPRYPDTRYPDSSVTGPNSGLVILTKCYFVRITVSPVNEGPRYRDSSPDNEDLTARFNLEICGQFRKIVNLKYFY